VQLWAAVAGARGQQKAPEGQWRHAAGAGGRAMGMGMGVALMAAIRTRAELRDSRRHVAFTPEMV